MKNLGKIFGAFTIAALLGAGCASGPLTPRESGAVIGGVGGAAAGGLVGAAVGHPAAGALIGGGLGLGAGALIGDQQQARDERDYYQDQEIRRQQYEIDRLRRERGEY
jgi:Glycine zipper